MKVLLLGAVLFLILGRSTMAGAQPSGKRATLPAQNSGTASANYVRRVRLVAQDLRWALAKLHLSWENYGSLQELIDRPRRDTDVAATREEQDRTKRQLLEAIKQVQHNAKRLRGLSPVPRSYKRIDEKLITAGLDFQVGTEGIATWLLFPSGEVKNNSARQVRRAQSTLQGVLGELARRTDSAITAKTYVE
jgi:hypothetical protein